MPSTWLQVLNPLFIVLLGSSMILLWNKMGQKQPSTIQKMAMGSGLLGLAFVFLLIPTMGFTPDTKMSFVWFLPTIFLLTLGELCYSPIGLSMVTKVAPPRYMGLLMGWWFFSMAGGNYFSGFLATFFQAEGWPLWAFFGMLVGLGLALGGVIFLMDRPLRKAVSGV